MKSPLPSYRQQLPRYFNTAIPKIGFLLTLFWSITTASFGQTYCVPSTDSRNSERITNVNFETISNFSDCSSTVGSQGTAANPVPFYSDWTNSSVPQPNLAQQYTYTITVAVKDCNNRRYGRTCGVFIDWNHNGTFDGSEELTIIFTTSNNVDNAVSSYTGSKSITIPASALTGPTRMRVMSSFNYVYPCNAPSGETEDYTINVVAPSCVAPVLNTASSVTGNSAVINWQASSSLPAAGYDYELRTSGVAGSGSTGLVTSGTVEAGILRKSVTGLTSGTSYTMHVRSRCNINYASEWVSGNFTTLSTCILPVSNFVPMVSSSDTVCYGTAATLTATGLAPGGKVATFAFNSSGSGANLTSVANTFSMELWVRPTSTRVSTTPDLNTSSGTSGQRYAIFPARNGSSTTNSGAGISVGINGISVFESYDNNLPALLVYDTAINGWTHIVVVYTNKTPSLYINGRLVATGLTSQKTNVYPSIGTSVVQSYGLFIGSIDNIRIWNGALTASDISAVALSDTALNINGKTAIARYTFNDGNTNNTGTGSAPSWRGPSSYSPTNYYTYTWSGTGAPVASTSETVQTAGLTATGNFTVVASSTCATFPASAATTVAVKNKITTGISGGTSLCINSTAPTVLLTAGSATGPYTFGYTINDGAVQTATSNTPAGIRYIQVQQNINDWENLAEIRAIEAGTGINVALNKAANSSGASSGNPESNINDGNLTNVWHSNSTAVGNYIQIDLGATYRLDRIEIVNRASCCWERSANLQLILKDSTGVILSSQQVNAWQNQNTNYISSWPVLSSTILTAPTTVAGRFTYKLVSVTSSDGCTIMPNDSITITVTPKAAFTTNPVIRDSICQGSTLTLRAAASNAIGYQWLKSGVAIIGATTSTYNKPITSTSDAGIYRLVALAAPGCNDTSTVSNIFIKDVAAANITGSSTVCQGSSFPTLSFVATGGLAPYTFGYAVNQNAPQTLTTTQLSKVRYILVQQNSNDWENIAEIRAIEAGTNENVALNKPTRSSGTGNGVNESNINDGDITNYWHSNSMDPGDFIQIDLGAAYSLNRIEIVNRFDCCWERAQNLQLILKDNVGTTISSKQIDAWQNQNTNFTTSWPVSYLATLAAPTVAAGNFNYKLMSVTSANGCSSAAVDSALVIVNAKAAITTQLPATVAVCTSNPLVFNVTATNAAVFQWQKAGSSISGATAATYTRSNIALTDAGSYRVIAQNALGCNDTSANSNVVVSTMANTLAASTDSTSFIHTDALSYTYTDASCQPIASVVDSVGGNVLGSIVAKVAIDNAIQTFDGKPYLQRHFDITPASNGEASVTLYARQAEFDAFNTYVMNHGNILPMLPTGPTDIIRTGNIIINQFHGVASAGTTGPGGQYDAAQLQVLTYTSITASWTGSYWKITFPVSAFSGFFITTSPIFILPIKLINITAKNEGTANKLTWNTASEDTSDFFEVERSTNGTTFTKIATVASKFTNGGTYQLTDDKAATGMNYYRLKMKSANGQTGYSKVVSAIVSKGNFVVEAYPNPVKDLLTIWVKGTMGNAAKLIITDASGKQLQLTNMSTPSITLPLTGLAPGMYLLQYTDGIHSQTLKINKQ